MFPATDCNVFYCFFRPLSCFFILLSHLCIFLVAFFDGLVLPCAQLYRNLSPTLLFPVLPCVPLLCSATSCPGTQQRRHDNIPEASRRRSVRAVQRRESTAGFCHEAGRNIQSRDVESGGFPAIRIVLQAAACAGEAARLLLPQPTLTEAQFSREHVRTVNGWFLIFDD